MGQLGAALGKIESAESLSAIEDAVRDVAAPLGYDRFFIFAASASRDEIVERVYWAEGDWFGTGEPVDALTYVRRCPVTRHILDYDDPFFWTKTESQNGEKYRVVKIPRGEGMHGLQIPVFGHVGLEGAISIGGRQIDASLTARAVLTIIGVSAFRAARRLVEYHDIGAPVQLTSREREVLRWTAAGRRQIDIAITLGLSERTVENHLRRARKRLGAHTTAQAIRLALRNGEIEE